MKLYECIVDDGDAVFKTLVTAKSKKELLDVWGGNGKFERIKDVTKEHLSDSAVCKLRSDLKETGWGKGAIELICALVQEHIDRR